MPVPEISPMELAERLQKAEAITLLDVREPWEWALSKLHAPQVIYLPLSVLAAQGETALHAALNGAARQPLVVICHHGIRSAQVTRWLQSLGWQNVLSLAGGLESYASQVDESIGRY